MKKYNIGVDLGGTKVLCALIEKSTNKILFEVKKKTKEKKGNEKITQRIIEALDELFEISKINKKEIEIIGLALAGQVDRQKGILLNACNLKCENLNLKEILENKYNIDTYIANDVEAATIAEILYGNAKEYNDILCVFIGTGIGSSIVINKKIHLGATDSAGELGHIIIQPHGKECNCGSFGCLEAYSSRSAIETNIKGMIKKGRKSIITDLCDVQNISSKHIKEALSAHDEVVTNCVDVAIEYLSCALSNVINFLNPQAIILGGGLIEGVDEFYLKTIRKTYSLALKIPSEKIVFKKAQFGDYSGVIGASLIKEYRDNV